MSQYPVINAGTTPTAAVLQAMLSVDAYKSGDQSVTSSTTLVNDSALVVPVAASATYEVTAVIIYTGSTAGDFKYNFTFPSGATSPGVRYIGQTTALAVQQGVQALGSAGAFGGNGATLEAVDLWFTLVTSLTSGNLQFQFAQNTSDAVATTVKTGSLLKARRTA